MAAGELQRGVAAMALPCVALCWPRTSSSSVWIQPLRGQERRPGQLVSNVRRAGSHALSRHHLKLRIRPPCGAGTRQAHSAGAAWASC